MRVAVDENDHGFAAYQEATASGDTFDVFLDGNIVGACIMADEEAGIVARIITDDDGNMLLDSTRENPLFETLSGSVRIHRRPRE